MNNNQVANLNIITPAELALIKNDLSSLKPHERLDLYNKTCSSLGLNPLTSPFGYVEFRGGKLSFYALKNCTDQLRQIHNISIEITSKSKVDDLYVVCAKASHASGRVDEDMGAVSITNLKGEALANAMLKAITKAKRRVTLSICGLGMLDETEVESIQDASIKNIDELTKEKDITPKQIIEPKKEDPKKEIKNYADNLPASLGQFQKIKEFREILNITQDQLKASINYFFHLEDPKKMNFEQANLILKCLEKSKNKDEYDLSIESEVMLLKLQNNK